MGGESNDCLSQIGAEGVCKPDKTVFDSINEQDQRPIFNTAGQLDALKQKLDTICLEEEGKYLLVDRKRRALEDVLSRPRQLSSC